MKTKDLTLIALFAALIAVCAWISIPTAVPFTLQTMAVFLSVCLLGGRRGSIAVTVYILLGCVGLPVFAGFSGGIGVLFGLTGGYIIGFLACALVMWGFLHLFGNGRVQLAIAMVLGLFACYALGTVWFMSVYTRTRGAITITGVLSACVYPFVIPDLCKAAFALFLSERLKKSIPSLS